MQRTLRGPPRGHWAFSLSIKIITDIRRVLAPSVDRILSLLFINCLCNQHVCKIGYGYNLVIMHSVASIQAYIFRR